VGFHETTRDGQPQSRSRGAGIELLGTRARPFAAIKALEDPLAFTFRDTRTRVIHEQFNGPVGRESAQLDLSAWRCVSQRVIHQIAQQPIEACRVGVES
jgi:hypothetical protein